MKLWCVTLSFPIGRMVSHRPYAVIAETADEAKAKAVAYVYPGVERQDHVETFTVEAEEDLDGVISGREFTTRHTIAKI